MSCELSAFVCVCVCVLTEGVKAEAAFAKDGTKPDPDSTDNHEFKIVLRIIRDGLAKDPTRWTRMAKQIVGVSEETTTGVKRLYEMQVSTLHRPHIRTTHAACTWTVQHGHVHRHAGP